MKALLPVRRLRGAGATPDEVTVMVAQFAESSATSKAALVAELQSLSVGALRAWVVGWRERQAPIAPEPVEATETAPDAPESLDEVAATDED